MLVKLKCPECDGDIEVKEVIEGEILSCNDCGAELEVSKKKDGSIELKVAESEGEDWGE
ncbi:MAG: lysine biosynthesis protein LysW [Candidatus Methanomethylicaceae archaeon]